MLDKIMCFQGLDSADYSDIQIPTSRLTASSVGFVRQQPLRTGTVYDVHISSVQWRKSRVC